MSLFWLFILEKWCKRTFKKSWADKIENKNKFFVDILKVNDENSRIRIQGPNPDSLARGLDPRIRIQTKMSWIRNIGFSEPWHIGSTDEDPGLH